MRKITTLALALLLTPALSNAATVCDAIESNHDSDVKMNLHWEPDFELRGDELTIIAKDGTEYSVTRNGDLFIDDEQQTVSGQTRADIARYVERYTALEANAKQIAKKATGMAITALTHALVALATQGEDAVDAAVEEKTKRIETAIEADAQNLCQIVIDLRDTERAIRAEVPAFGPFIEFDLTEVSEAG